MINSFYAKNEEELRAAAINQDFPILSTINNSLKLEYEKFRQLLLTRGIPDDVLYIPKFSSRDIKGIKDLSRTNYGNRVKQYLNDNDIGGYLSDISNRITLVTPENGSGIYTEAKYYLDGDSLAPPQAANKQKSILTAFPEITRKFRDNVGGYEQLFKGEYFSVFLIAVPRINPDPKMELIPFSYFIYFVFNIDNSNTDYKKLLTSVNAKSKVSQNWIGLQIIRAGWDNLPIPPFFTQGGIDDSISLKGGIYKLTSGRYLRIPARASYRKDLLLFKTFLEEGKLDEEDDFEIKLPKNRIFFINKKTHVLTGTDETGNLQCYVLKGLRPISDVDRKIWLSKPCTALISASGSGLAADFRWVITTEGQPVARALQNKVDWSGTETIGSQIDTEGFETEVLNGLEKVGNSFYGATTLLSWMTFMGGVSILKSCVGKVDEINNNVRQQRELFEKTDSTSMPAIPNLRNDMVVFPHQGTSLAKLNVSQDLAIIDIGTGGGKTCIIVMDILNQLQSGNITRPLVVMPSALIPQWVGEIGFFTNNTMNVIVLNSKTANRKRISQYERLCQDAPLNTIFLSTYSFIRKGAVEIGEDYERNKAYDFPSVNWLVNIVKPDYLALDESHFIKNASSSTNKALTSLGDTCRVKRIATGTLIPNNPTDLVGQLQFLDPCIVGNPREFAERYSKDGNVKNGWKDNFADDLREHLKDNTSYIMYREKDWASLLPTRKYSHHLIDMTQTQAQMYKVLVTKVMEEINDDPNLKKAFMKMQLADADFEEIPPMLLGKLAKLEQYLTCPTTNEVLQFATGRDTLSCKLNKIDELIDMSLQSSEVNNKVIVAVHYKESARHLQENSRHKDKAVYYDASNKKQIEAFKSNPNIKVMFAVQQSLSEGHNLQMANRIIVADVDWTPGKLKQLEARIFRPHVKIRGNKVENLNKDKVVYIDTVLANDSADCLKFALQVHKKVLNANIMENCPLTPPEKVGFGEEVLSARFEDAPIYGRALLEINNNYSTWLDNEIEEMKKTNLEMIKPKIIEDGNVGTYKMEDIPWISGMNLELRDGEETLLSYLESNGFSQGNNVKDFIDLLHNKYVRCEQGIGVITGVTSRGVRIKTEKGAKSYPPDLVIMISGKEQVDQLKEEANANKRAKRLSSGMNKIIKDEIKNQIKELVDKAGLKLVRRRDKVRNVIQFVFKSGTTELEKEVPLVLQSDNDGLITQARYVTDVPLEEWKRIINDVLAKHAVEEDEEDQEVYEVEIHPASYNDIPCLIAYPDEEADEEEVLFDYGFSEFGMHWSFKVPNRKRGIETLDALNEAFDVPKKIYDECLEFINDLKRNKYPYFYPEEGVRNFMRDSLRKSARGALRVYPLVVEDDLFLIVDIKTNPGVNLSKFRFKKEYGFFIYISKNISDLKKVWKDVNRDFLVLNKKQAINDAKDKFDISLPTK